MKKLNKIKVLIETVHRLRAPDGCPWDREQTHLSLRPHLIEEAYEVLDVLDQVKDSKVLKNNDGIRNHFREELGDLFLQILLHSELTDEVGAFDIYDVAEALNEKLIRRHPHVFGPRGSAKVDSSEAAYKNWEKQKEKEKSRKKSVLDGLPRHLAALHRCQRMIQKVSRVGFQWKDMTGPLKKLDEELGEFKREVKNPKKDLKKMQNELGDLLFCICNIAHFLKLDPEAGLRSTLSRFESRFRYMESRIKNQGKALDQTSLDEMDQYWKEAKKAENND